MKIKKALKIFFLILIVNAIENMILLWFFGVPLVKQTIVSAFVFSATLSYLIDKFIISEVKNVV